MKPHTIKKQFVRLSQKKRQAHPAADLLRLLAILIAAFLLIGSVAVSVAQDKSLPPPPKEPPPRVPFTAFRTKPILELKLREGQSLVVQDAPTKIVKIRPKQKPAQDEILFSPSVNGNVSTQQVLKAPETKTPIITTYAPVPPPKPVIETSGSQSALSVLERVFAEPVEKIEEAEQATPTETKKPIPASKPVASSVRIRETDRFSSQSRMGGTGTKIQARSLRSLGLPDDMQDLRLGSLKEQKGISPVLMPGQVETKAAPDEKRINEQGIPNDVIVFFMEGSSDLEVGQMDIVNNDVIAMLQSRPNLSLEIVGYAEAQGADPKNTKKMALSRALIIQQYLIRKDIDANRLTITGKGDETDIEPRDRVEMFFSR